MSSFSPTDLLSLYSPTGGQFNNSTASLAPPSSVRSTNPNTNGRRFNIIAGSSFTISCDVQRPSGSFVADFYIDNLTSPITNETLADTFITKTDGTGTNSVNVTLTFNNFQAAHNGRYICQATTTDGGMTESRRIGHAQYGTGEQCHCVCVCVYTTDCGVCVMDGLLKMTVDWRYTITGWYM